MKEVLEMSTICRFSLYISVNISTNVNKQYIGGQYRQNLVNVIKGRPPKEADFPKGIFHQFSSYSPLFL